ncbi:MAG: Hpt domain-containing protein [Synechococcales cyanobacterium RM1_1_8]|nr:Hpt domain-containing protein [Synechococcales cyanobacterium RM1_1_8]
MAEPLGQGLIDWRSLQQLSDGDRQFEKELLTMFVQDAGAQLPRLKQAIAARNASQVGKLAHYLKGASGNIGILPFSHCAATLETQARQGNLAASEQLLAHLQGLLNQVQQLLKQMG